MTARQPSRPTLDRLTHRQSSSNKKRTDACEAPQMAERQDIEQVYSCRRQRPVPIMPSRGAPSIPPTAAFERAERARPQARGRQPQPLRRAAE